MSENKPAVSFCTLGCRVNQYESDAVAAALKECGVRIVRFGEKADLAVVNTCTVTAESDRKSRQMIRQAARNARLVAVVGCYSQIDPVGAADGERVVYVGGNGGKALLAERILKILSSPSVGREIDVTPPGDGKSAEMILRTPQRTRSYIKIEDGCDNRCTYCLIRKARGPVRSKPVGTVLDEIRSLASLGVQEIILTGIEVGAYGADFAEHRPRGYALADLIAEVSKIDGIRRIGLGSLDPVVLNEYFAEKALTTGKFLPHLHLSLQSGCSGTLARMRRQYSAESAMASIERARKARPDVTFSSDIITGFPGESENDFEETVSFCRKVRFLHLHVFPYSVRAGTEAAGMPNQIPEAVRKERTARLIAEDRLTRAGLLAEYVEAHRSSPVHLLVEKCSGGISSGHSEHFIEVTGVPVRAGIGGIVPVLLASTDGSTVSGVPVIESN